MEIDGEYGEVQSIGMRALRIVTADDTVVVIPHQRLWDGIIKNATDSGHRLLCVGDFFLHPHHDAALAVSTLRDVTLTSAYLQLSDPVTVTVRENLWATHYRVKAYPIAPSQQFAYVTDLTVRGKAALSGVGVAYASATTPMAAYSSPSQPLDS